MNKNKKVKLTIELIPSTCHFSNARTMLSKKEWDKVRFISYDNAKNVCEICGDTGKNQGYKHNVECHEVWSFNDETHVQKLENLISLCVHCHQVKHIGRAIKMGRYTICVRQLGLVNKWTREQIDAHIAESFEIYKERSKHEWELDITLLEKAPYEIKLKKTTKRIFEVKKYKKKRKKKKPTAKKTAPKKVGKRPPRKKT